MSTQGADALLGTQRALVVDKEPSVRSTAKELLTRAGFEVTESPDGQTALSIANQQPCFDLLVAETQPVGIDGWTLAAAFQRLCPAGRVILMSDQETESINAENGGECLFVHKARLTEALVAAVRSIGLAQLQRVILLVDDEPVVRNVVQNLLSRSGYAVITAVDGQEALEISRAYRGRIDLLVSDIKMPRLGGLDLAEQLRLERPGTPVLLMSGHTEEVAPRYAGFIEKPFLAQRFVAKVREVLKPEPQGETGGRPD